MISTYRRKPGKSQGTLGDWLLLKYGNSNALCYSSKNRNGHLYDGWAAGLDDCRNKCESNSNCKVFSYWESTWCRIKSECDQWKSDGSYMIYSYQRKSEGTLGDWSLLKSGNSNALCSSSNNHQPLYHGWAAGLDDCRNKCESNSNCKFFSYWETTWCQTRSECDKWKSDGSYMIYSYRRKSEGKLRDCSLLKSGEFIVLCFVSNKTPGAWWYEWLTGLANSRQPQPNIDQT